MGLTRRSGGGVQNIGNFSEEQILNYSIKTCIDILNNQHTDSRYIESANNIYMNPDLDVKTQGFLLLLLRIIKNLKNGSSIVLERTNKNVDLEILCEGINISDLIDALNNSEQFAITNNLYFPHIEVAQAGGASAGSWEVLAIKLVSGLLDKTPPVAEVVEAVGNALIRKLGPDNVLYYSLGMAAEAIKLMAVDNAQMLLTASSKQKGVVALTVGIAVVGGAIYALTYNGTTKTRKQVKANNGRQQANTNNGRQQVNTNNGRQQVKANNGRQQANTNNGRQQNKVTTKKNKHRVAIKKTNVIENNDPTSP
jgi:hypothetical protein